MGNCIPISSDAASVSRSKSVSKKRKALPIDTTFDLPSTLPNWPPGTGFATRTIDLGGLIVTEITTFNKVWETHEGGPGNAGATFFEPTGLPDGFFPLGFYAQPNNRPLFGCVLVGKDGGDESSPAQTSPIDYALVWTSKSLNIKEDSPGYIWAPIPVDGYQAVGLVITTTPDKPPLERIRCVRSDLTAQCEPSESIWSLKRGDDSNEFNIFESRPTERGKQASSVSIGTFIARIGGGTTNDMPLLACLKNAKMNFSSMPNLAQVDSIIQAYAPRIYNHPDEEYLPSSINWFFTNGALLYKKGDESNPIPVDPTGGSNLPQGGSDDGSYWIDLPIDKKAREGLMKGNIGTANAYIHIKPMFGGTYTDLAMWLFSPFNGPSTAKVGILSIPLGKIGEHVGDWEHVTLRVSNFNGVLRKAYFSQHSGGEWVYANDLEFQDGSNRFIGYASLHGHACYPKPGVVLQGNDLVGIRNDTGKSDKFVETGKGYTIISADYLGNGVVLEPVWLNYARKWGPKITYNIADEINKVADSLPGKLKTAFLNFIKTLPAEVLGEEGPTGPKMKRNWDGGL